jgi:hypothetical protein
MPRIASLLVVTTIFLPEPLQENQNIMYTAQRDLHGNVIVCKGSDTRRGYRIVFTGSYADCLRFKVEA